MSRKQSPAAIVGIGQTEFSSNSGRSELQLAVEAINAALAEAGLTADDVDGLATFDMDSNDPCLVANTMGMPPLTYFLRTPYGGGGGCAAVMGAAMAVATGAAEVVVAYRGMNERSGVRFGTARVPSRTSPANCFSVPYGIHTPAQSFALNIARYMHTYGVSNADIAPITLADRKHAATNPNARFYGQPITLEDHQSSRWIVEPALRLLDCCLESDGAVAVVITSMERARDLRQIPVEITAASQGLSGGSMRSYYGPSIIDQPESKAAAGQLWSAAQLGPADVQTAVLYDHFTPMVLMQIEAFGFCAPGDGKHFIADGRIELGGQLPVNPNGGQLGEAYIHGMNGVAEAVRQVRGTAVNQVPQVEHVLVTSGSGVPTSALILGTAG